MAQVGPVGDQLAAEDAGESALREDEGDALNVVSLDGPDENRMIDSRRSGMVFRASTCFFAAQASSARLRSSRNEGPAEGTPSSRAIPVEEGCGAGRD